MKPKKSPKGRADESSQKRAAKPSAPAQLDVTLELLRRRPFPEIAAAIRARAGIILERWQTQVKQSLPTADELTMLQLRDDMPAVLDHLATALEVVGATKVDFLMEASAAHGEARFHQSYNVNELLIEYDLLRPIMIDEVMAYLGRQITVEEIVALNMGIDAWMRRGVVGFVRHQTAELKSANDAQAKYLSFLSHDLRGGLNGVMLMIEVLKRELVQEPRFRESVEELEVMRRSILDTVSMMDRFLYAERFRGGNVQMKPVTLELKAILTELQSQFVHQVKEKGLELRIEVEDGLQPVTDRELLMLILQNLLSNAIKYTSKGAIRVTARCGKSHMNCMISVYDPGPGIPPEKMAKMFAPFSRGETHGQPGVGLGLYIARQAADALGAELRAESTLGQGTAFHLELR